VKRIAQSPVVLAAVPYLCMVIGLNALRSGWTALLLYHAFILLVLRPGGPAAARRVARSGWSPGLGLGMCALSVSNGLALLLLWRIVAREPDALSANLARLGLASASWWLFAAYYVTVHPALEELFWRHRLLSHRRGVAFTDLAFAGYHALVLPLFLPWFWVAVTVLLLASIAWLWRRLNLARGGLAVPIASHAFAGIGTMVAVSLLRR
jgi:hypothetical protein